MVRKATLKILLTLSEISVERGLEPLTIESMWENLLSELLLSLNLDVWKKKILLLVCHLFGIIALYLSVCKASCGIQGCVDGTIDQCCHKECLGGCTRPGSNRHCHACMNYRTGSYGFCVSKCPRGMYVVSE